jgi:hypothetical protein
VGFVLHDDSERQNVSPEVEEFLSGGPPPLVFTPGSAAATLKDFFRESVEACRIGAHRAMLVTNFPEQLPANLPPGVRAFSYVPVQPDAASRFRARLSGWNRDDGTGHQSGNSPIWWCRMRMTSRTTLFASSA